MKKRNNNYLHIVLEGHKSVEDHSWREALNYTMAEEPLEWAETQSEEALAWIGGHEAGLEESYNYTNSRASIDWMMELQACASSSEQNSEDDELMKDVASFHSSLDFD